MAEVITNVDAFISAMVEKEKFTVALVFRGQREATWGLIPKIERPDLAEYRSRRGWDQHYHERQLFSEFEKAARPYLQDSPSDQWELLALAQHHGLSTRLLDWTRNPLVALYFAVEEGNSKGDSAVWAYQPTAVASDRQVDPFAIQHIHVYDPPHISPRIVAQSGCFTAHPPGAELEYFGELTKTTVGAAARKRIKKQLASLGMTRASLFPGLDGLATYTNWRFSSAH